MSHVLVIDNVDSFTFNLVQQLRMLGARVTVRRNHDIDPESARALEPTHLVVSPGPGRPEAAGASLSVLEALFEAVPILGVCLGHQCIGQLLGADIVRAPALHHGKASMVHHDGDGVLQGLPAPFLAGRYHSLVVDEATLPDALQVTARSDDGVVMAMAHRDHPVVGVQFHPESVLTPDGPTLLDTFLAMEAS